MSPVALVTADLDQNRRLEVEAALVVVLDTIAVFPRREPSGGPLTGIDPKTRALDVLVIDDPLAVAGRDVVAARVVRNFDDFPEELVRLLFARARVPVAKATTDELAQWLDSVDDDLADDIARALSPVDVSEKPQVWPNKDPKSIPRL